MILEVPREKLDILLEEKAAESSADMMPRVMKARNVQQQRYTQTTITCNADVQGAAINTHIPLDESAKAFLKNAAAKLHLSPRVIHRIMKLARTIADMDGADNVQVNHLAESLQYRSKTLFVDMAMF
jgi:magnesium chelatase family protein